jgi:hypothetical protein
MAASTSVMRTLALAAETLGSVAQLAAKLNVPLAELERWIAGTPPRPHNSFYLEALDIVSAGSFK